MKLLIDEKKLVNEEKVEEEVKFIDKFFTEYADFVANVGVFSSFYLECHQRSKDSCLENVF